MRSAGSSRPESPLPTRPGSDVVRTVIVLMSLLMLLTGCGGDGQGNEVEFKVPVSVREVGTGTVEDRIVATGTLRAERIVSLRSESAGILQIASGAGGRRLAEGDRVAAGQAIAEITGEDVRLAARTDSNRSRYQVALRDHESKKLLFEEGLISDTELQSAESALADARLELDRSLFTESRSKLLTPIGGVLLQLARDESGQPLADGQLVAAGQTLAQVANTATLIADINLVGPDAARVIPGQEVRLRHHAWEDHSFAGKVIRLAPSVDSTTRTLRVEVELDNREGRLKPGMFIEATVVAERRLEAVVVPRAAVTERAGRKVLFVLKGQKVELREVGLGLGDDDVVEVRGGIASGERVVIKGLETLTDGARVRVSGS